MARITINGGTYETFDDKNMIGTKHIDYIYRFYKGKCRVLYITREHNLVLEGKVYFGK